MTISCSSSPGCVNASASLAKRSPSPTPPLPSLACWSLCVPAVVNFAAELAPDRAFRVAVNHEVVAVEHPLKAGDEVAIFPPVTGG